MGLERRLRGGEEVVAREASRSTLAGCLCVSWLNWNGRRWLVVGAAAALARGGGSGRAWTGEARTAAGGRFSGRGTLCGCGGGRRKMR